MNRLAALLDAYSSLSPDTLDQLLTFYAPQARFKDPFNEVQGRDAIRLIFEHMYANSTAPRFEIVSHQSEDRSTFVVWVFHCGVAGRQLTVRGVSHLQFDAAGLVATHRDYWDAAEEMWQHLPLLGKPVAWLRRRFRAVKEG